MRSGKGNFAFIDGANLHRGIRELGWKLDYTRFRAFLADKYQVTTAYLFLGFLPEMTAVYRDLQNYGYTLVFKPTLRGKNEQVKGNCDAELVLQAVIDLYNYDQAVIVTGDGDFACLVTHLQKIGKLAHVISPNPKKCSILLKRAVPDKHLFLDRFRSRFEWNPEK